MEQVTLNKGRFIRKYDHNIEHDYQFYAELGFDYYSTFHKASHLKFRIPRCIKHYRTKLLADTDVDYIKSEIHYLKELDHPNIIKVIEIYEYKHHIFAVSEFLNGKTLFERMARAKILTEQHAASVLYQILQAVAYLHSVNIAHRDIKPEYIVFENESAHSILRLTDFKSALRLKPGKRFKKRIGTPYYMAPEVINGSYDLKCDIWSCGVLLYVMLCGYAPFNARVAADILMKVRRGAYRFPERDWGGISSTAKDLITRMLTYDPAKRSTAAELLDHQWFKEMNPLEPDMRLKSGVIQRMKDFRPSNLLRTALLLYFVAKFDFDHKDMTEVFYSLDKTHDGILKVEDLELAFIEDYGKDKAQEVAKRLIETCDLTHDSCLTFSEFMVAGFDFALKFDKPKLQLVFEWLNKSDTGELNFDDIKNFFNFKQSRRAELVLRIIAEADMDKNMMVSFDEFMDLMTGYYNTHGVSISEF